jgi:O-antigen ligase
MSRHEMLIEQDVRTASKPIDDAFFFGLLAGLAWVPFWFGSNRPLAWGINALWFCGLVILYEATLVVTSRPHPVSISRIWPAVLGVTIVGLWCLVQISTALPAAYEHPIWQMARDALALDVPGSISVNRDATVLALLRLVTAASAFWLALQLCRSGRRARLLVAAIAVIGLAYAVYGVVAFFAFPKTILWFPKVYYFDSLTSTFVNRNSYATYAGIGLIAALAMTVSAFSEGGGESDRKRQLASLIGRLTGGGGAWLAVAAVVALALVLTGSRGGISVGLAGVLMGSLVAFLQRRGERFAAAGAGLIAVLLIGAVLFSFSDLLAQRLSKEGFQSDERLAVYDLTLQSIGDRPLLGFGYGTFEQVFPMYRDASIGPIARWDKAHNTYLELAQGLGLPAAAVLIAAVGSLVWLCVSGAIGRRRFVTAPLAASAATAAVLLHAFVDFSLQMQAVAITWMALLGAGVAQSWSSRIQTDR